MAEAPKDVETRLQLYAERYGCTLERKLGFGWDGIVFSTNCLSAIKGLRYEPLFLRERDVYRRLEQHAILSVLGFSVPRLVRSDDEFWVIEMTLVKPPFVLDFAGAYLDTPPDFPPEVMEEWYAEKLEQFDERWPEVRRVIAAFRKWGIYLSDVKPGNIEF